MEVVIHGTKGGYRILYKTPGAPSIGNDIRNNVSSEAALGKSAYSIAFAANGCVFTKYIIIRDTLRSDATGFIAFSLFLLLSKELLNGGADVKAILDDLSNHYVDKYVRNNSINKGESDIIQEDWIFVENILGRKSEQNRSHYDVEIQPGTKEAALVFYEDDVELQEYFSKPFQEEYNGYKQILLINGKLDNSSADLLRALRNSSEQLKIDLRNEPFYLNNYNPSRGLSITSNGKPRSDRKKNNVIRAKEKVELKYTKDYHKSIEVAGTLSNPNSDIFQYLNKNGSQIIIEWDKLSSDLKPFEKIINFDIRDWWRNSVNDVEITCHNNNESKAVINNKITFQGDDLGKRWMVSAKNNSFYSENKIIDFEKGHPDSSSVIDIVLNKHRLIITVHEESLQGDIITKGIDVNKTEFTDSEIEGSHRINVSCRGYKSYSFEYSPKKDKSPKHIYLQKEQFRNISKTSDSYNVSAGKHGMLKGGYNYKSNTKDGSDVKDKIVPNKGFQVVSFALQGDTLVAQYEKKPFNKNRLFFAGLIVGITAVIIFAVYNFLENGRTIQNKLASNPQPATQYIQAYIEGNSLLLDTLNFYKDNLGSEHSVVKERLNTAIKKREFINDRNFAELKKLSYYSAQEGFKTAIFNIDSTQFNTVKGRLPNVSSWNLNQIADSINAVLNSTKPAAENSVEVGKEVKKEKKKEPQKELAQTTKPEQKREEKIVSPPANINNTKDATNKLQSGTITKDELKEWKAAGMDKLNKSIDLYLKFWDMVASSQKNDFDKLLNDIKADATLKSSELKSFLNSICASSDAFEKYNMIRGKAACKTINELRSKVK